MDEPMVWTTPSYEEIKMDAEIGSYQLDDERAAEIPTTRRASTTSGVPSPPVMSGSNRASSSRARVFAAPETSL